LEGLELYTELRNRRMDAIHRIVHDGVAEFTSHDRKIQMVSWKYFLDNQGWNFEEFINEDKALIAKTRKRCSQLLFT